MPRTALPDQKKRQLASAFQKEWLAMAVEDYRESLARQQLGLKDFKGAKTVAKEWMQKRRRETKKVIKLNPQTIINHAKGKHTQAEANQDKSWTTPEENDIVIHTAAEYAARGWPFSHRRLKEQVDEMLRARLGPDFRGVGKRWTYRFVLRHSDRLATELAAARESVRGGAVNATSLHLWFHDVLRSQLEGVDPENIYGSDEHSWNGMEGQREHVIVGRKMKGRAHQQTGGSRENVTFIATICAVGYALPPTVILKGKGYQVVWGLQNNPLNASIGHSLRGWTNGEIGVAWIKEFDRLTKDKAAGRPRLLLLDGHNSHYTRRFLEYARAHNIRAICYPAHTTHVLQGLDVVVFGPLKRALREERVEWERTHPKLSKNNILEVYAKAHLRTMTPSIIKSAFRVTGVWPFDPSVIPSEMIAPSKETSNGPTLPLPPMTPVRVLADLIDNLVLKDDWDTIPPEDSWTDLDSDDESDDEQEAQRLFGPTEAAALPSDPIPDPEVHAPSTPPTRTHRAAAPPMEAERGTRRAAAAIQPQTPPRTRSHARRLADIAGRGSGGGRDSAGIAQLSEVVATPPRHTPPRTPPRIRCVRIVSPPSAGREPHARPLTSSDATPLGPPATPVRRAPAVPRHARVDSRARGAGSDDAQEIIQDAMKRLGGTALERLVSSFTSDEVEFRAPLRIPPTAARGSVPPPSKTLNIVPETSREAAMHTAMLQLEEENKTYRRLLIEYQAINILNQLYNKQLKEKLAIREQQKGKRAPKGRLMGDGLPVVLTGDEFYRRVVAFEEDQRQKEAAKKARAVNKSVYEKAMAEWRRKTEARDALWKARLAEWEDEKEQWRVEKAQWAQDKAAKKVKGAFPKKCPKRGDPPPSLPKPKLARLAREPADEDGEVFDDVSSDESSSEDEM